jgi:hypothetical protein
MFARNRRILFDAAETGATGSGTAAGNQSQEPQAPFSEAQVAALGQVINAAITSHSKRQKPLAEELKTIDWKGFLSPVVQELTKPAGEQQQQAPTKPAPEIAAMQAKIQELTTALQQQAEVAKQQTEAARNAKAMADLKTALAPHVRPEALEIAASHLFVAQKRVTFDENGNPLLTVRRAPFQGAAEEDVPMPLADGIQHWARSSEGKFFSPPPSAAGATQNGQGPRRAGNANVGADGLPQYSSPATTDAEKMRRAEERAAALLQRHPHLSNS